MSDNLRKEFDQFKKWATQALEQLSSWAGQEVHTLKKRVAALEKEVEEIKKQK
jgi:lysine/ornithine N-monooxygenase